MSKPATKISPSARHKARKLLVQALYQWQFSASPVNELLAQFLANCNPKKVDIDYFQTLLPAIIENSSQLSQQLQPYANVSLDEVGVIERSVLWLATYELQYCLELPYRVVINEAVELTKIFGATDAHKFVNGVVDKLAQQLRPHG